MTPGGVVYIEYVRTPRAEESRRDRTVLIPTVPDTQNDINLTPCGQQRPAASTFGPLRARGFSRARTHMTRAEQRAARLREQPLGALVRQRRRAVAAERPLHRDGAHGRRATLEPRRLRSGARPRHAPHARQRLD